MAARKYPGAYDIGCWRCQLTLVWHSLLEEMHVRALLLCDANEQTLVVLVLFGLDAERCGGKLVWV
jgi:hypothetical protein